MRTLFFLIAVALPIPAFADEFNLAAPESVSQLEPVHVWATQYYDHAAKANEGAGSVALRDKDGHDLGVSLSKKDWCNAAMEGTVIVTAGSQVRAFNAGGLGAEDQTDCGDVFPKVSDRTKANIRKQRFFELEAKDKFGMGGTDKYRLIPYRSIAVDRDTIPWGTALFIPRLKGARITLPDGSTAVHDGYVYAVDRGSEINGSHIDFFTGVNRVNPAPGVITSTPKRGFVAYIVKDDSVVSTLRSQHVRYGD
ncbi:3D domain-containing protein [Roseiarcus fermentans]|uniref:3D domain-containing protein n=1 Tax=Roseiarcus fermentans TaxID=1473586 RepID=A0A366FRZ3_9HYPH|nr:3D domain-containing protein [Roseiarcus fermentans]RBP17327.1 3D domain-containing protein [Roseiarcus fermentans]